MQNVQFKEKWGTKKLKVSAKDCAETVKEIKERPSRQCYKGKDCHQGRALPS